MQDDHVRHAMGWLRSHAGADLDFAACVFRAFVFLLLSHPRLYYLFHPQDESEEYQPIAGKRARA